MEFTPWHHARCILCRDYWKLCILRLLPKHVLHGWIPCPPPSTWLHKCDISWKMWVERFCIINAKLSLVYSTVVDITAQDQLPAALHEFSSWSVFFLMSMADFDGESLIARAFNYWNSKVGVPAAVWDVLESASVYCETCQQCRSFDGDRRHRVACEMPIPTKGKGKQRALEHGESGEKCLEMVVFKGSK